MIPLRRAVGLLFALAFTGAPDLGNPRIFPCRHVHSTPGVFTSLLIAEHPRGVAAVVEICNATSRPIHPDPRTLPRRSGWSASVEMPTAFFVWEESAVPAWRGRPAGGDGDVGPTIAPGMTLTFDLELTEHYQLVPDEYCQVHYSGRLRSAGADAAIESNEAGFSLRLTD